MTTLRKLREEKTKLSQRQMARLLGISPGCLCHYERGIRQPGLHRTRQMASILGVDMQVLVNIFLRGKRGHADEAGV